MRRAAGREAAAVAQRKGNGGLRETNSEATAVVQGRAGGAWVLEVKC